MALGLSLLLLETLSAAAWWFELPGSSLTRTRHLRARLADGSGPVTHPTEAIHPYLGWVLNPDLHPAQEAGGRLFPVNRFGLVDDGITVYRRAPDQCLVGIVGGSVAQQVSLLSDGLLKSRLEAAPELKGRRVKFVRLALSGHKQPQQLMSLSYLLALGGELDVLVNIDGYNEVALSITENAVAGVALSYPRLWQHRLQDVVDPRVESSSFRLLKLRASRREAAQLAESPWLRSSPTANLVWLAYDKWVERSLIALGDEIRTHQDSHGRGFARSGPVNDSRSEKALSEEACRLWRDCSRQLHRLCAANGIRYVHVLQPSQYDAGSKPLTDYEKEKCYVDHEHFADAIRTTYPLLRQAGGELKAEGVTFCDATQLFAKETETIYSDWVCHFNQKGNDLLAEKVAACVIDLFRTGVE